MQRPDITTIQTGEELKKWYWLTLTPDTVITDSYTNGEHSRRFFRQQIGPDFAFSIPFMDWLNRSAGKTLRDAVAEWNRLEDLKTSKDAASAISAGNQFNQYLHDFFADNPGKSIDEARQCWKRKRSLPLGKHAYERSDMNLTDTP